VLGRGGFGITYQGETATTLSGELGNMDVRVKIAIKEFFMRDRCIRQDNGMSVTVPAEGSHQQVDKYKAKFISEARNLSNIHHPNIINVSDVFEENQTVYYVMQYQPGGSLTDKVKGADVKRLSEEKALRYIHQIADALTYLHSEKHICHLDVKPANILLSADDNAILIDFGIAKTFDDTGGAESSTSSVSYSNNYAPLEQYQTLKEFSPQTDLYSLGATLYYMLTGETPPEATKLLDDGFPRCPYYISTPRIWQALELAMKPVKRERPDTVARWIRMLDGQEPITLAPPPKPVQLVYDEGDEATVIGDNSRPVAGSSKPVSTPVDHSTPTPSRGKKGAAHTSGKSKKGGLSTLIMVAVVVICCAIGFAVYKLVVGQANKTVEVKEPQTPTAEAMQLLAATDLTMARIQEIERDIKHNGTDKEESDLKGRIMSLKHLYLEGLMADHRTVKGLYNIYVTHAGEFSKQQRELMIWFFDQPKPIQMRWEHTTTKPQSLDEFKKMIESN
jgi:serine/threonine protein kinase